MSGKQEIYDLLNEKGIEYRVEEHKAVFTVDEMREVIQQDFDQVAKNLFVRDDKKQNYYLLVMPTRKSVDLKTLKDRIHSRRLSFVSDRDLMEIMQLEKGAVNPFGVLRDEKKRVKVYLDAEFKDGSLGIHPNDNTSTVWLKAKDLEELLKADGNRVEYFNF